MLNPFIGPAQMAAVRTGLAGEEHQFFANKLASLAELVTTIPTTGNGGYGDNATAHLHYFAGGQSNWYITERDSGCADDGPGDPQHQAYGLADDSDCAEMGYISIVEILANGGELDFHWTPQTVGQIRGKAVAS